MIGVYSSIIIYSYLRFLTFSQNYTVGSIQPQPKVRKNNRTTREIDTPDTNTNEQLTPALLALPIRKDLHSPTY